MRFAAAAITVIAAFAVNAAFAQGVPAAVNNLILVQRFSAISTRCNWGDAFSTALFQSVRQLNEAEVGLLGATAVKDANSAAAIQMEGDKSAPCTGADANAARGQIGGAVDQMTAEWAMRISALASVQATEPWAANITTVGPQRQTVERLLGEFQRGNPQAFAAAKTEMTAEVKQALLLVCDERRTLRATIPRACPSVLAAEMVRLPWARALVAASESLGPPMAVQIDARLPPPPKPSDFYKFRVVGFGSLAMGAVCNPGDLVIKPGSPAKGGTYPVTRYGQPAPVGQATVGMNGSTVTLLSPDAAAMRAGVSGLGVFEQCS